ncbi:MAG: MATE family efflux transporter [Clostridiales bacterium]|nr:MATE family efflux transporter [Clostridiales bacterium]
MDKKQQIFETMPVPKAVASLALPTILSQLITTIYNLADTLYIGQTGNPYMVAAVSLSFVLFFILNAIANLFGIGGGSLISRMMGAKQPEYAKRVCSFSFWSGGMLAVVYILFVLAFMDPLLSLLGASENTIGYARDYVTWVIVVGGVPVIVSMLMGHFLRSVGYAKESSIGIAAGGVLNIILDPIFIFPLGMGVKGAAIATMLSNVAAMTYYLITFMRIRRRTVLSIAPKNYSLPWNYVRQVLSIGFPACIATLLASLSNSVINKLTSTYGDIPVAAFGIVKKIDVIPMSVGMGLSHGMLPLIAYNYSAKNYERMKSVSRFGRFVSFGFSAFCVVVFQLLASTLLRLFISDAETIEMGSRFLRIACLAVPLMQMNFLTNTTFQAMGKGWQSLILTACRQGLINIPLLFLMNSLFGLIGIIWTQLAADALTLVISTTLYAGVVKKLDQEELAGSGEECVTID